MELAAFVFVICLLLPGIWWIAVVRGEFKKKREDAEESYKAARVQPRLQGMTSRQGLERVRAAARKQPDIWKNMTPSFVSEAFGKFYEDDAASNFESSLVSAAFEKFTEEMSIRH